MGKSCFLFNRSRRHKLKFLSDRLNFEYISKKVPDFTLFYSYQFFSHTVITDEENVLEGFIDFNRFIFSDITLYKENRNHESGILIVTSEAYLLPHIRLENEGLKNSFFSNTHSALLRKYQKIGIESNGFNLMIYNTAGYYDPADYPELLAFGTAFMNQIFKWYPKEELFLKGGHY